MKGKAIPGWGELQGVVKGERAKFSPFHNFHERFLSCWVQLRVLGDTDAGESDSQTDIQRGGKEGQTSEVREGDVLVRMWLRS